MVLLIRVSNNASTTLMFDRLTLLIGYRECVVKGFQHRHTHFGQYYLRVLILQWLSQILHTVTTVDHP
jgi:hypothetical protein